MNKMTYSLGKFGKTVQKVVIDATSLRLLLPIKKKLDMPKEVYIFIKDETLKIKKILLDKLC